jgi:DivIVA domain-containing protein
VDKDSIDRIRAATFPVARRGYEQREVDRFLNRVADWLETGGGDQARSDLVRRELERIGQKTGQILNAANDAAAQIQAEAETAAADIRDAAERLAAERIDAAQRRATEMAEAADRRRGDIETLISDLEARRDAVLGELRRLAADVAGAASGGAAAPPGHGTEASNRVPAA